MAVIATAACAQLVNTLVVRSRLCSLLPVAMTCDAGVGLASVQLRFAEAVPIASGVVLAPLGVHADTSLLRKRCDGQWQLGPGARLSADHANLDGSFGSIAVAGTCADAGDQSVTGGSAGVHVVTPLCAVKLAPFAFSWGAATRFA